jgi:hypothetical protein
MNKSISLFVIASALTACGGGTPGDPERDYADPVSFPLTDSGVNFFINIEEFGEDKFATPNLLNSEPPELPGQDASYQVAQSFNYSKLVTNDGGGGFTEVDPVETSWDCTRDNKTGLFWENKVRVKGSSHFDDNKFIWYDSNDDTNGGYSGHPDGGQCTGLYMNTEEFVELNNNEQLCGFSDWRVPTVKELRTLIDYSKLVSPDKEISTASERGSPMTDLTYFPNVARTEHLWTSQTDITKPGGTHAFGFHMNKGQVQSHHKDCRVQNGQQLYYTNGLMLVRGGN